ncbi:protein translocase subunit SecDF [Mucilaginibacter myungsuensis]|uniref:Multifunctional fusion protein n=1 Tax=Mucilaginibacter myungsuensis TaxID=649104 RepID=A0A929PXK4_9SPHI|nr:protein translocase subunit SecDF [Mucilaginibacter myungsuensis]MBE9662495.1 protein translocase subunit SecDF [Mucilaginibacter myungsuensis]MDN3597914.1 protein translocase subunit SecDF [Mucilaginibacter myungsuensis]
MQGKGVIKFFAVLLAVSCLYQLSFTWVTKNVEKNAEIYAKGNEAKEKAYLDSVSDKPVYPLFGHSYQYCKNKELALGLDLKGGMNVTMQIDVADLIKALSNKNPDADFNKALSSASQISKTDPANFVDIFMAEYKKISPNGKLAPIFATKENQDHIKFNASNGDVTSFLKEQSGIAVSQTFQILRTRIDKFGVTQPNIQLQTGTNRILVELPGVTDKERVRKLLQGSAKLEFYATYNTTEVYQFMVNVNTLLAAKDKASKKDTIAKTAVTKVDSATIDSAKASLLSKVKKGAAADTSAAGKLKSDTENPLFSKLQLSVFRDANGQVQLNPGPGSIGRSLEKDTAAVAAYFRLPEVKAILPQNLKLVWSNKPEGKTKVFELHALKLSGAGNGPVLTGEAITDARAESNMQNGGYEVIMNMNSQGAETWGRVTAEAAGNVADPNDNKAIAIVLDDNVVSAPRVENAITGGNSNITGNFSQEETKDLANILKAGRLPAPARIVSEEVVGPSLGQESINHGLAASIAGLAVVLIFMVAYYNRAGTVAVVAVIVNVFFLMGVLTSLGAVLTLDGIAGIILILGIAVDANVLVYERVREEMAHGKSLRVAVSDGYKHALPSILDANISTFLTGLILFTFGSGPILGFATTLMIGITTSLFCSLLISRLIFEYMLDKGWDIKFSNPWSSHTFKNANFGFVKNRFKFYTFSAIFIGAGLVSMFTQGFNYGVDFQGGRTYEVRFDKAISTQDVRDAINTDMGEGNEVKTFGGDDQIRVTTNYLIEDQSQSTDAKVEADLRKALAKVNPKFEIIGQQKVGPTIANDLKTSAILTVLFAIIVISAYILIRFRKWQFSLGAMVATVHDSLLVLSFFSLFKDVMPFSLDIDQKFIAAILTVIGYSINDTVVVFDRIREYLTHNNAKTDDPKIVINQAINSTLSRTIITALTVIFVLVVLFIFGGDVLRGFSFALLIGVIFGTYSSICVASPVIVEFGNKNLK